MKENNKYICPSCGQEIKGDGVKNGENIYCEKCRPPQTKEKTITLKEEAVEKAEVGGQTTLKIETRMTVKLNLRSVI
jgi:peptide subunit release factor 1 (eRF1)